MTDVAWPKGGLDGWQSLVDQIPLRGDLTPLFNVDLEPEILTDKNLVKILPCQFCQRPLVVTTFYVLAWAKCSACKGVDAGPRARGSVDVAQAGRTDPKLVKDLTKVLINPQFANAICPVHPDNEEHVMELKHVHFNDNYGPGEWRTVKNERVWVQTNPGETVMHQCTKCLAIVTYSTTAVINFHRMNEPAPGRNANVWATTLDARGD